MFKKYILHLITIGCSPQYSKHFYSDAKQDNDMIHQKSYLELISMCHEFGQYLNLKV